VKADGFAGSSSWTCSRRLGVSNAGLEGERKTGMDMTAEMIQDTHGFALHKLGY
jgi:hypothetical protein